MGFCNKARKKLRADASLSLSHAIIRYLHPFTYILFPHLFSLDTHSIVTIFHARNSNLRDSLRKLDFSVDNTLSTERTTIRIYIYIYTSLSTALSRIASQPRRPCDISFSGSRACNPHVRVRVYNYVYVALQWVEAHWAAPLLVLFESNFERGPSRGNRSRYRG